MKASIVGEDGLDNSVCGSFATCEVEHAEGMAVFCQNLEEIEATLRGCSAMRTVTKLTESVSGEHFLLALRSSRLESPKYAVTSCKATDIAT